MSGKLRFSRALGVAAVPLMLALTSVAAVLAQDTGGPGSISGRVLHDLNADGTGQQGEPGLAGRMVHADLNGNGQVDQGELAETDDTGGYTFIGVAFGNFVVTEVPPSGWRCSAPPGCGQTVAVSPQNRHRVADFLSYTTASVAGVLFNDLDGDGIRQADETAVPGLTVYADRGADGTIDRVTSTGSDGGYALHSLDPGLYRVGTAPSPGSGCSSPPSCVHELTLTSEQAETGRDFAIRPPPGEPPPDESPDSQAPPAEPSPAAPTSSSTPLSTSESPPASSQPAVPAPRLLSPFPIVRIRGRLTARGVRIDLLQVRAPRGSTVRARCSGRSCPVRRETRTVARRPVRLRRLEAPLRAGAVIEIRITKPGRIGKYTRFRILRGRPPVRTDRCIMPGTTRPTRCPS